jgi:hypothetical protein
MASGGAPRHLADEKFPGPAALAAVSGEISLTTGDSPIRHPGVLDFTHDPCNQRYGAR